MRRRKRRRYARPPRRAGDYVRPTAKAIVSIVGWLGAVTLTLTAVLWAWLTVWGTASGDFDGSIAVGQRSISMNATLEAVMAWLLMLALAAGNLGFYHLMSRWYRKR